MLGIGPEIETLPVTVARENMSGFVVRLGLLSRGQREFRRQDTEQQDDSGHEPNATGKIWFLLGHNSKNDENYVFTRLLKVSTAQYRTAQMGWAVFPVLNSVWRPRKRIEGCFLQQRHNRGAKMVQ